MLISRIPLETEYSIFTSNSLLQTFMILGTFFLFAPISAYINLFFTLNKNLNIYKVLLFITVDYFKFRQKLSF